MSARIPYQAPLPTRSGRPIPYQQAASRRSHPIRYQSSGALAPARVKAWQRLQIKGVVRPLSTSLATEVLIALRNLETPLVLELSADFCSVDLGVVCQSAQQGAVTRAIRGAVNQIDIVQAEEIPPPQHSFRLSCWIGQAGREEIQPLRDFDSFVECSIDPLGSIVEAVQPLRADEQLRIQYLRRPTPLERVTKAYSQLTVPLPAINWVEWLQKLGRAGPRGPRFEPKLQRMLEDRLNQPIFEAFISLWLDRQRTFPLER
jgi:hypothetical protein